MSGKTYKHKETGALVEATQFFDPYQQWPAGVISWSTVNYRPRDMSWGFVQTRKGRVHVCAGDWIVRNAAGELSVYSPGHFEEMYESSGEQSTKPVMYTFVYEQQYSAAPGWEPDSQRIEAHTIAEAFQMFGLVVQTMEFRVRNVCYGLESEMLEEEERIHRYWQAEREKKKA